MTTFYFIIIGLIFHETNEFIGLSVVKPQNPQSDGECMMASKIEGTALFQFNGKLIMKALICKKTNNRLNNGKRIKLKKRIIFEEIEKLNEMVKSIIPKETKSTKVKSTTMMMMTKKKVNPKVEAFRNCRNGLVKINNFHRKRKKIRGRMKTKAFVKFLCDKAMKREIKYREMKEDEIMPIPEIKEMTKEEETKEEETKEEETKEEESKEEEEESEDDDWGGLRKIEVEELYK